MKFICVFCGRRYISRRFILENQRGRKITETSTRICECDIQIRNFKIILEIYTKEIQNLKVPFFLITEIFEKK